VFNLPEVRLRISSGFKKLEQLRAERQVISEHIQFWEEELTERGAGGAESLAF